MTIDNISNLKTQRKLNVFKYQLKIATKVLIEQQYLIIANIFYINLDIRVETTLTQTRKYKLVNHKSFLSSRSNCDISRFSSFICNTTIKLKVFKSKFFISIYTFVLSTRILALYSLTFSRVNFLCALIRFIL